MREANLLEPNGKADDLWCNTAYRGGRAARCCGGVGDGAFRYAVPGTRRAVERGTYSAAPRAELPHFVRRVGWLVAGIIPALGGPESCWLVLCSQHSAKLGCNLA